MHRVSIFLMAALALVLIGCSPDAGSDQGSKPHGKAWVQKTVQTCASCHGMTGVPDSSRYPIIAGQYKDYLLRALKDYREGRRSHAVMTSMVKGMSNAQLEALAAYYARQESSLHTPSLYE